MVKVATWNVNSIRLRMPQILQWLDKNQPDILALQETKVQDKDFPTEEIRTRGYYVSYQGEKSYNGVALISKIPGEITHTELINFNDPQRRVIGAKFGSLNILNVYVPNGSSVGSEKYLYKLNWLKQLEQTVIQILQTSSTFILLGDFNIAPEDSDVHDPQLWEGEVLVSEAERESFRKLLAQGLVDSFRLFPQDSACYSWWDYRGGAFRRNNGLRIDLILVNHALTQHCVSCKVDIEPRKATQPSDHAPVVAEFNLESS